MKDAIRGFRNITSGFPSNGNSMAALAGLLVFCSATAFGQVVLDDFSTDTVSHPNYVYTPLFGTPLDGWVVAGGELRPSIDSSAPVAWLWKGEKLSATGDSVSISLSLPAGVDPFIPTSIGLFLSGDAFGYEITSYTTLGGDWYYNVGGAAVQATSPPSGPVQLTIQRTGQDVDGFVYSVMFSGTGVPPIPDNTFTDASASLMFGPLAYNTAGASTPAALDNFTFTAVPEPSLYTAVFGFLALTMAGIRTHTAKRA